MRKFSVIACLALAGVPAYSQSSSRADADLGEKSGDTGIRGYVTFEAEKGGVRITETLRGLDEKKSYDIHLLANCDGNLNKARQTARRLLTIKPGIAGETNVFIKDLNLDKGPNSVIAKGLLLSQGDNAKACGKILPPFGPPPGGGGF